MEEVHDFGQGFLGLVLTRHVGEGLAGLGFDVDFRVGFAQGQGFAAEALAHAAHQPLPHDKEQRHGQDERDQEAHKRRRLGGDHGGELDVMGQQAFRQPGVPCPDAGFVEHPVVFFIFDGEHDHVVLLGYLGHLVRIHQGDEFVIGHFAHLGLQQCREHEYIQQQNDDQSNAVVIQHGFPLVWLFFHVIILLTALLSYTGKGKSSVCRKTALIDFASVCLTGTLPLFILNTPRNQTIGRGI